MEIIRLTEQFYSDYAECKEILHKRERPYCCLAIMIDGKWFAIPFRHHITHKHCFHTIEDAGLDYTKAVVITKREYIDKSQVTIDSAEYNIIKSKEKQISNGMRKFVELYKKSLQYPGTKHYDMIRNFSSLKYFYK